MNHNKKPAARYKKPTPRQRLKRILLGVLSVVAVLGVAVTAFLVFYKPDFPDTGQGQGETHEDGSPIINGGGKNTDSGGRKDRVYTFLLAGMDATSLNTDVVMLATYDVPNKSVSLLQIPRDTYVTTDSSHKRINYQYKFGYVRALEDGKSKEDAVKAGMNQLKSAIENTLAIPVDQYALVDLEGFRNIVDIMGGVDVDVPLDMKYSDPEQGLKINLRKGPNHLDGDMAEQLIRYRQGDDGSEFAEADIGRIKVRKIFLSAMFNKLLDSSASQITKYAGQFFKHLKTDITTVNLLYFAKEALNLSPESIHMHTAPGESTHGGSYYSLYADETIEILNKYYNPLKNDITKDDCDIIDFERQYDQKTNIDGETVDSITEKQPEIPIR